MEYVTFMINKWYEIGKYCQYLSVFSPLRIGFQTRILEEHVLSLKTQKSMYLNINEELEKPDVEMRIPLLRLLLVLEKNIENLIAEYHHFVQPLFSDTSERSNHIDSFVSICVRYQFYSTFCVINRLMNAIIDFLNNEDLTDETCSLQYLKKTLLPKRKLYHTQTNDAVVVSNRLNFIYQLGFYEHVNNMIYPFKISTNTDKYDFGFQSSKEEEVYDMNIVSSQYILNNILKWSAELNSYPVFPPDITGKLVSTTDKRKRILNILKPGLDNAYHHKHILDTDVCFNCKFLNLCVGQIDDTEQRDYLTCFCNYKKSSATSDEEIVTNEKQSTLDNVMTLNARSILNLIFLSNEENEEEQQYGCQCQEHRMLFQKHLKDTFHLITKLRLIQNMQ